MLFACIGAGVTLILPLIIRYITSDVIYRAADEALQLILKLSLLMLGLIALEFYCNYFIAYYGHIMGAKMEYDMRNEIFSHYQKLSFSFFDNQKVGQLMSRVTNDLFEISELYHQLGATFLYVTHDQVEAMTLAEKILVLRAGNIEQYGTPDDIYLHPASVFVAQFMGSPSMNMILGVWWLGNLLYPEVYDYDMTAKAQEIYKVFWNYDLTAEEAAAMLG